MFRISPFFSCFTSSESTYWIPVATALQCMCCQIKQLFSYISVQVSNISNIIFFVGIFVLSIVFSDVGKLYALDIDLLECTHAPVFVNCRMSVTKSI